MSPQSKKNQRCSNSAAGKFLISTQGIFLLATITLSMAVCTPALAAADVFAPYLDFTIAREDNPLRFHDTTSAMAATGSEVMADTIKRTTGGLHLNKTISQQVLSADLNLSHNSYQHFSQYDNDGKDLAANWNWHLGSHVEGNLSGRYAEEQTPFQDFLTREPNINRQRTENFDAAWRFHPSWRVRGAYGLYALAYDLATLSYNDRNLSTSELGIDFLPAGNGSVGVQMRHIRADYPNDRVLGMFSVENSYTQNELKGKVDWRVTEKTKLEFLGGLVRKNYDALSKRNFNGGNSRLQANWGASAKLNLKLAGWNEVGSSEDLSANYSLNRGLSAGADWQISSKVRMDASYRFEWRDYSGLSAVTGLQSLERKDHFKVAVLGLSYVPLRHVQVGASLSDEILDSNFERYAYRARRFQLSARYDFGLE